MDEKTEARLIKIFIRAFRCDTARISKPCGKLFLIIGRNRNTKDDAVRWFKNGEPIEFDYVFETVIASGDTPRELVKSARGYRRLLKAA